MGKSDVFGKGADHYQSIALLRALGFSLSRCWPFLVPPASITFAASDASFVLGQGVDWLYTSSVLSLAITLLLLGFFPRLGHLAEKPVFVYKSAAALSASVLLSVFSYQISAIVLMFAAQIIAGVANGILQLHWASVYAKASYRTLVRETPLAICLASLLSFMGSLLPPQMVVIAAVFVPLAICATVFGLQQFPRKNVVYEPVDVGTRKLGSQMVLSVFVVAIIGGCVRSYVSGLTGAPIVGQPPFLLNNLVGLVIVYGFFFRKDTVDFGALMKCALVLLACSVLLVPVIVDVSLFGATVLNLGFTCFRLFTWIALLLIVKSAHLRVSTVVGFGWGLVSLGEFLGTIAFSALDLQALGASQVSLIIAVATIVIIVAMLVPFDAESLTRIMEEPNASAGEAADGGADNSTEASVTVERHSTFEDRCRQIAEEYSLTPKETEIMYLMSKGYSGSHLCEKLVLSRSTISTHQQHIYRKMDIHSKRELLDIIDGNL